MRAELLRITLPKLARQRTELEYEVIFVDNGSTDETQAVIAAAMELYPGRFRYFYTPPSGGPSRPRNIGVRNARGEIVIILDDDVVPEPDFVQHHWNFHQRRPEPECAALGEVYVPNELKRDPMSLFHDFPYNEVRKSGVLSYLFFWTCNVSLKREYMLNCGMFSEDVLYYEDLVCGHKLAANGMRLYFCPEARGAHMHKLRREGVPKKGRFIGRWLFALTMLIPELAVKERFGILTPEIGWVPLMGKLLRRAVFRVTDNPLTLSLLKLLGAEWKERNPVTDLYYYLIFRRNMLAGYYEARAEFKAQSTQSKELLGQTS